MEPHARVATAPALPSSPPTAPPRLRVLSLQAPPEVLPASTEAEVFEAALDRLWVAFQPIVRPGASGPFAYEALMRSRSPALPGPGEVLAAAERLGRLHALGRHMRTLAARAFAAAPEGTLLFVNLHPQDLLDPDLLDPHAPLSRLAPRVVLELTERAALPPLAEAAARVGDLRAMGFRVAVDDLGEGFAGLTTVARLRPEYVKLDMSLVRDVGACPLRQALVRAMSSAFGELGIGVVAEGVETSSERAALLAVGCELHQGYLYGRPAPAATWWP